MGGVGGGGRDPSNNKNAKRESLLEPRFKEKVFESFISEKKHGGGREKGLRVVGLQKEKKSKQF